MFLSVPAKALMSRLGKKWPSISLTFCNQALSVSPAARLKRFTRSGIDGGRANWIRIALIVGR